MALFDITAEVAAEQAARGTLLQPGWYTAEITKVDDEATTKAGDAMVKVDMKALDGVDSEGNASPGVKLYTNFMPAYPGFIIPFANALGAKVGKEGKKVAIDKNLVGRKLKVYVIRSEYKGRSGNEVADYRPVD